MRITSIYPENPPNTPDSTRLAEIAYDNVTMVMKSGLASGKHTSGGWNMGIEKDPKWHLTRAARHAIQALMVLEGLDSSDPESAEIHIRNAMVRCVLAFAQITGEAT